MLCNIIISHFYLYSRFSLLKRDETYGNLEEDGEGTQPGIPTFPGFLDGIY